MGINIKNPETVRLIDELAELTGEGKTEAVTKAVRERIASFRQTQGRLEKMIAIADEMAPLFKPPYDTIDHDELLYDKKTGLPK
ncbi:type II toxin-antitoxin system VapB family antitoxin [Bauldia sp.]|uniref:type II toxin-antitoxin system VapB family antitoxin n=1 Tax=Bauldia sp. TaxID=2575872 RepID=UPI003BAB0EBE